MTTLPAVFLIPTVAGLLAAAGPATPGTAAHTTPRPASAAPARSPAHTVGDDIRVVAHRATADAAHRAAVLRYWTTRRMRRAVPLTRPLRGGTDTAPPRRTALLGSGHTTRRVSADSDGARWPGGGAVAATTGRVFLTVHGHDYYCSASAVHSANHDTVVTAGHCVYDTTDGWATRWTFVPGYRDGDAPYGRFTARRLLIEKGWTHGHDDSDVGMVALATDHGRHLTDVVGAQDIAFGARRSRRMYAFGYPAEAPYDGGDLVYCSGAPARDPHGDDDGLRCDMTAGASGGPWLSDFDTRTGRGTVTSVTSYKYTTSARVMYGPRFGSGTRRLYDAAQRS